MVNLELGAEKMNCIKILHAFLSNLFSLIDPGWTDLSASMDAEARSLCERLVPAAYISQGEQARHAHENKIKQLLQHVITDYAGISSL